MSTPTRHPLDAAMPRKEPTQFEFAFDKPEFDSIQLMGTREIYEYIDNINSVELKEDRRIERKVVGVQAKALGDYFSAFANTPPDGGIIIIGVEDDGSISGCKGADSKHINELERAGDIYCPSAKYECKFVRTTNKHGASDRILVFHVRYSQDKVIETVDGSAYIRRGESKRKLSEDDKRELRNAKGQVDLETESVSLVFPEDFKQTLINQFVSGYRESRHLESSHTSEEILALRHLGKISRGKFTPNLACALLFAKDPASIIPGCRIRFLRFNGTQEKTGEDYNVIKSEWIEGPVPELIVQAAEVIASQVREFSALGRDNKFYTAPEYPADAWYEAVVNACVHRSYSLKNMNIFIKMFDDRLVVESPGGFPPMVTPDNIYDMHQPRNPHLMDAMFYLKFVQCAHEGTRRIRDSMRKMKLPAPEFAQREVANALVQVTLRNDIEHRKVYIDTDAYEILGERLSRQLTEYERRVVNFIAENRAINVTQVSKLIDRRWGYAKKILNRLVEKGVLDHIHHPKIERDSNAYYTLKKRFADRIRS